MLQYIQYIIYFYIITCRKTNEKRVKKYRLIRNIFFVMANISHLKFINKCQTIESQGSILAPSADNQSRNSGTKYSN